MSLSYVRTACTYFQIFPPTPSLSKILKQVTSLYAYKCVRVSGVYVWGLELELE